MNVALHTLPEADSVQATDLFLVGQLVDGTWQFRRISKASLATLIGSSSVTLPTYSSGSGAPAADGVTVLDLYQDTDTGAKYIWNGSQWI